MKKVICVILYLFAFWTLIACSGTKSISYDSYDKLVRDLENKGYTVKTEDTAKNILNGERKWLTINEKEHITVFLYPSTTSMKKDASYISDDGFSYNDGDSHVSIDWVSYPHFYKASNMIVLYVGEDSDMIDSLKELVGYQFAGARE